MRPAEFSIDVGDAVARLAELPAGTVQTCVTSPPYFGLRDYGHAQQLGQEPTVGAYVDRLVRVFDEVARVLRDDGTVWLNLGDSYAAWQTGGHPKQTGLAGAADRANPTPGGRNRSAKIADYPARRIPEGYKPKDLLGVPWRVAFALQDAGWYLRKEIIWNKPDPMPESVKDRPTSSHEHVFLLAKSRDYFYDLDGYREPAVVSDALGALVAVAAGRLGHGQGLRDSEDRWQPAETRQLRDVWTIPLQPFPGAHFAVFPPELPRRCIRLGTSPKACDRCRAPFVRILHVEGPTARQSLNFAGNHEHAAPNRRRNTIGWRPSCTCGAPPHVQPGDLDVIASPIGEGGTDDPSADVGRRGFARERGEGAGVRLITRYEQRMYARQLAGSPHRAAMESHAGADKFAHYLRSDRVGARAIAAVLFDEWLERAWIELVEPPEPWWRDQDAERCVVLDPFTGAGTTGLVAVDDGRDFLGVELNADYAAMATGRIAERWATPRLDLV